MLTPRRWRRPVRTSPLLSSKAQERGRVPSKAEAEWQAQLSRRVRALHAAGIAQREERVKTGLGLMPGKDTLGFDDVTQVL
jgi:hypothetical protein